MIPGGVNRRVGPTLGRHPQHPVPAQPVVPHPEIQRSAPPPRRAQPVGVFRSPALTAPTRNLTRPAPVRRAERALPPAPMPSYPVLRHYTRPQQNAVVRGIQRSGQRVADRGAIRPQALAPLAAVRRQQETAANRTYARNFGVTPQQAAQIRHSGQQAHAALPTIGPSGFDLSSYLGSPQHNLLVAGYPGVRRFLEEANRLAPAGRQLGQSVGDILRHAGADVRGGKGTVGGVTPAFLRSPVGSILGAAGAAAPTLGRLAGGAGNDLIQFTLGAVPGVAQLGGEALHSPSRAVGDLLKGTEQLVMHPLDHPLGALQILHGGVRGVSRGVGAVGRSPLAPAAVRDALGTRRAPLQIAGPAATRLLEYRHYSKDPLVKGLQVLADRRLKDGARVIDQHGRQVQAKLAPTAELGGIRGSLQALHTSTLGRDTRARLRAHGDFVADRANAVERHNRAAVQRELVSLMPTRVHRGGRVGQAAGGYLDRRLHSQPSGIARLPNRAYRPERDVIGLIIRGRVRNAATFRADLEAELHRLEARAGHSFDHPEQRAINLQNQESIRRTLADPRAMDPRNIRRLVDTGRQLAVRGRALTRQAEAQGALAPEAAARAPLFDYAQAHMDARYVHPNEHAALEKQALIHERAAAQSVQKAHLAIRQAEKAIKDNAPQHATPPQGGNFLNRPHEREMIDDLAHQHGELLKTYNELARRNSQLAEQMNAIPAGPQREAFREKVYRPASDEFQKVDTEARKLYNVIEARKERLRQANSGELVTGQPERPVKAITWYHGTPTAFHDLPTGIGATNDLGVYLTSDPHYAGGYGTHGMGGGGPSPAIQMAHVNPRKVLETRFGRVKPHEIVALIDRLHARLDTLEQQLRTRMAEYMKSANEMRAARGEPPIHPETMAASNRTHAHDLAHRRAELNKIREVLTNPKNELTRALAGEIKLPFKGEGPVHGTAENALEWWRNADREIMRGVPFDVHRMERTISSLGDPREPWKPLPAAGQNHQATRLALRELGYDAVRKVDQHADSLVVVNESVLRAPGQPRPRPGAAQAHVQLGSHLEAQGFERAARQHNVHVTTTTRKGDGVVAHVEGDPAAIERLAAQHAYRTNANVLAFHHDSSARGGAFTVREKNGATTVYLESNPTDSYVAQLRAAHPNAEITATPGHGRMLTPESHAAFARDIQTAGDQTGQQLARDLESAHRGLQDARQAHAAARAHRVAVSGRDPALVDRHEQAVARAALAKRDMKKAQAAHARAVQQRDRAVGASAGFRDRRAMAHGERPTGRTVTETDRQLLAGHETAVKHALDQRRAAEQAHRVARDAVPRRPDISPALRTAEGKLLTNEEIHAHMRANGIPFDRHGPQIAYLPDRPDVNSRASYHRAQALLRRDSVEQGFHRTGAAQQMGITGQSFNLVADHMVRMGITTGSGAIGQFDRLARESGIVHPDGRPFTGPEAELALRNLNAIPDQPKMVAVRLMPGRAGAAQRDLIQRIQNPEALDPTHYGTDFKTYVERSFAERVASGGESWLKDNRTRNVALMPEELVNRFQQHLSALGNRSPTGALLSKAFRTAVLPFSSKWLVGNVAEAVLRLGVIGAGPLDYIAGRRVMTAARGRPARTLLGHKMLNEIIGLDVQHAGLSTELGSSLLGGLLFGEPGLTVHRGISDYEHSNMRVPAQFIGGLAHTTMLREIGHELNRIPQTIFHLNKVLEQQTQVTALGRYVRRDIHEFTGSYVQTLRLQKRAIEEAARGLYNTAAQRDAARFMDETLGKYSRFSPRLRALIQTATPFLPWYLNAARFVFWTLPVKHPTKTAVLMAAEQAFSKDWAAQHKDLPPGELKAAVKSGGGWLDLARFTPFGAATGAMGGDPSTLASPFFPQVQGIYHALSGQDPFGRQLQVPKTPANPKGKATGGDIAKAIADQALGAFLPGYTPAERVANHGETPYGNSSLLFGIHTKPGSSHGYSGLERWLDPVRPVFLHPNAAAATGPPPGVSKREYEMMLREARSAAQSAPATSSREQQLLLKEARQAAGVH